MIAFRALITALATSLVFGSPALAQTHPEALHVHGAYARVSGGEGASGAVFFTIHNNTAADLILTGASTGAAHMAGLHTHIESADGLMQMVPIDGGVALPFAEMHEFARGGDHIMLMGLTKSLVDGDVISVTLTFDAAPPLTFDAVIDNARPPEAAGGHDHSATTTAP
jgi:periplasmic copper chaperone A